MPKIHVVFPVTGKPSLRHEAEICPRGEVVTWCFHSANPAIKSVEVKFEDAASTFFGNTTTPLSRRKDLQNGEVDFYGHVPNYPVPLPAPKFAKYTVKGWTELTGQEGTVTDTVVEYLDPVIVTSQP